MLVDPIPLLIFHYFSKTPTLFKQLFQNYLNNAGILTSQDVWSHHIDSLSTSFICTERKNPPKNKKHLMGLRPICLEINKLR